MLTGWRTVLTIVLTLSSIDLAQETHNHPAPETLGAVLFPNSCKPAVQSEFNRAVALLHSFAYSASEEAFRQVSEKDPGCAMAHWGIAMTFFHQLWEPPISPTAIMAGQREVAEAMSIGAPTERENQFIRAAASIFMDAPAVPYSNRALNYERAMADLARENQKDVESQVFHALALLAVASPADSTHARQKKAIETLEPLYRSHPEHPGIAHYLIHAYDNAELAGRGLPAAKAYSKIAPSAPHALHMPSHIFTRLGLWDDSVKSNQAARQAARKLGDTGEELHAMDYLVYAFLQSGKESNAHQILEELKSMPALDTADFKIGYAATAMPIRYVVERRQWTDASVMVPPTVAPPHVVALSIWAQGLGLARGGKQADVQRQIADLQKIEGQLQAAGNSYWATQVRVMQQEVKGWSAQSNGKADEAVSLLRAAADEEDSVEKLPVTPGPIVPAREQLGELLLEQHHSDLAAKEFRAALKSAPGRRGALQGAEAAAHSPAK